MFNTPEEVRDYCTVHVVLTLSHHFTMHKQSSEGRFCKPKYDAGPTRFLYVSGVGEELHSDVDKLVNFFSHFGALDNRYVACPARDYDNDDDEIDGGGDDGSGDNDGIDVTKGAGYTNKVTLRNAICMIPNRRYIYVCYLSVQSATAALTYIRTQKGLQSNDDNDNDDIFVKKLCANYAEERVNMVSRHTGIQCSSANTAHVDVPGCHLIKDFISIEEEKELLSELAGEDAAWRGDLNRRVQVSSILFMYFYYDHPIYVYYDHPMYVYYEC